MLLKNVKEFIPKFDKFPAIVCVCCNSKDQTDNDETTFKDETSTEADETSFKDGTSKGANETSKGQEKNEDKTLHHRKPKWV